MFLYGGCGGNHNNFENKTDCQSFCADVVSNSSVIESINNKSETDHTKQAEKVKYWDSSFCLQSPRHGNCHEEVGTFKTIFPPNRILSFQEPRWFFSHWDNMCKPYNYSGCGANMNSFLSLEECEVRCPRLVFTGAEARCERLRWRGHCEQKIERFFYDKFTQRCVKFGACPNVGEEENNFEKRVGCVETCKHGK